MKQNIMQMHYKRTTVEPLFSLFLRMCAYIPVCCLGFHINSKLVNRKKWVRL